MCFCAHVCVCVRMRVCVSRVYGHARIPVHVVCMQVCLCVRVWVGGGCMLFILSRVPFVQSGQ